MLSQNTIKLFSFYKDEGKFWSVKTGIVFCLITWVWICTYHLYVYIKMEKSIQVEG